jgi:toxin YoeB
MGKYRVTLTDQAKKDLIKHFKSGNKATIKKIEKILLELSEHPTIGTGNPEQLKFELAGLWSRRLNQKDRLIYEILEDIIIVDVISAMGHYQDK